MWRSTTFFNKRGGKMIEKGRKEKTNLSCGKRGGKGKSLGRRKKNVPSKARRRGKV